MLTIDLAMELVLCNIWVKAIPTGITRTDMVDKFVLPGVDRDNWYEEKAKVLVPPCGEQV